MDAVTLHTTRLTLSPPRESDAEAIFAACQDPLIQRFTTVPSPYTLEHATGFIEKATGWWESGSEATWAIRLDDDFAGMIGMHRLGRGDGELGYWMAPHARRQGILLEAAEAVIDWSFAEDGLGLARITWRAVASNTASAQVAQRLGFRHEGTCRQALVNGSGLRDDGLMAGLLPTDDRTPQPWPALP